MTRRVILRIGGLAKPQERRGSGSSIEGLSASEGYSGVEDIDGDDEDTDENDVEAAEAEHLTREWMGRHGNIPKSSSPRPIPSDSIDDDRVDEGDDEAASDGDVDSNNNDEDDDDDDDDDDDGGADVDSGLGEGHDYEDPETTSSTLPLAITEKKSVRFADVPSYQDTETSQSGSDQSYCKYFPDIMDKSKLPSDIRHQINNGFDLDSSASESFWDTEYPIYTTQTTCFNGMNTHEQTELVGGENVGAPMAQEGLIGEQFNGEQSINNTTSTSTSASAFASVPAPAIQEDEDATDDDEDIKPISRRKQRERFPMSTKMEQDKRVKFQVIEAIPGKSRVAQFTISSDHEKPVAVIDRQTGKMLVFAPPAFGNPTSNEDLARAFEIDLANTEWSEEEMHDWMGVHDLIMHPDGSPSTDFSTSADLLLPGMVYTSPYLLALPSASEDEGPADCSSLDEDEQDLNIDSFFDFGGSESGTEDGDQLPESGDGYAGENDQDIDVDNRDEISSISTPARPSTSRSEVTGLSFNHTSHYEIDASVVGAFRRDQKNHQLISNGQATRSSLEFGNSLTERTIRGIKPNHLNSAQISLSPARKQKSANETYGSPLSGLGQKRKSSENPSFAHKRQRSSHQDQIPVTSTGLIPSFHQGLDDPFVVQ